MYTLLLLVHLRCVSATTNVLHRFSSSLFSLSLSLLVSSSSRFIYSLSLVPQTYTVRSTIVLRTYRFDHDAGCLTIVLVERIQRRGLSKRFRRSCNVRRKSIAIDRLENISFFLFFYHPSRAVLRSSFIPSFLPLDFRLDERRNHGR